jgi:hypothetical protein
MRGQLGAPDATRLQTAANGRLVVPFRDGARTLTSLFTTLHGAHRGGLADACWKASRIASGGP